MFAIIIIQPIFVGERLKVKKIYIGDIISTIYLSVLDMYGEH